MAGEDELTRLLEAWQRDIESVPFPAFTFCSITVLVGEELNSRRGRPGVDRPVEAPRNGRGTKAD